MVNWNLHIESDPGKLFGKPTIINTRISVDLILEKRTSLKIACPEEIALYFGWITREQLKQQIKGIKGKYFEYLHRITQL